MPRHPLLTPPAHTAALVAISVLAAGLLAVPSAARAGCADADGDGFEAVACGGADCDDSDADAFPGAAEACDGLDTDCDGLDDGVDVNVGGVLGPTLGPSSVVFDQFPDGGSLADVITVTGAPGPVMDLDVVVWLLPDFAPHVVVTLTSPSGTEVELISGTGEIEDYFDQTTLDDEAPLALSEGVGDYVDSYRPVGALTDFDGEPANGDWTLTVTDTVLNFSGGIFNEWGLELQWLQPDDADLDGWNDGCGDCDGSDAAVFPGAAEVCDDGVDQDCDGSDTDGDFDGDGSPDDVDGDGADVGVDCDDGDPNRAPGAAEVCDDGLDQDCDGADLPSDADEDGALAIPCGGDDCDDLDPASLPGFDADGDGVDSCADCDDDEALNFPDNDEQCDGLDNDCDGLTDEDDDGDGATACLDCDETDATVFPGAPEVCDDGVDQDCDGVDLPGDVDGDGFVTDRCGGTDCDDAAADFFPGAEEVCDGLDRDCDGLSEAVDEDADFHFDADCGGDDCDDSAQGVHPDSVESCNQVDDDCDDLVDEELDCGDDDDDSAVGDDDDSAPRDDDGDPGGCAGCSGDLDASTSPERAPALWLLPLLAAARRRRHHQPSSERPTR